MTEKQLLKELAEDTYVTLKPSPLHGIGVFAIRKIPKGCRSIFSPPNDNWIRVSDEKIKQLPKHAIKLVKNYCLPDGSGYYLPNYGFKTTDLVNYLNHSDTPNIISVEDGNYFEAIRNIKAGEELLVDYGQLL